MKTLAVIGAGPALGMSMARRFGREGHRAGLIARNRERLEAQVAELAVEGIEAAAFTADVTDRAALSAAIEELQRSLGPVDVLEYNPTPLGEALAGPEATTVDSAMHQLDYTLLGAITAVQAVLPGMIERGDGALLFTGGYSSRYPVPSHANAGLGLSALRNYAYVLNRSLGEKGVYAGTITVAGIIRRSATDDRISAMAPERRAALEPFMVDPDQMADLYWDMTATRDRAEEVVGNPQGVEATWR